MSAPHALVTGGAGFIGAHLSTRLLDDGWGVTVVDDLSRGHRDSFLSELADRPSCRFIEADLRSGLVGALGTSDFTHVVHLAAVVGVQNVIDAPDRVLRTNVDSLHAVLDVASRQPRLERLVFPSTSEVYAGTLSSFGLPFPTPEDVPLAVPDVRDARASYMVSKIYGEAVVSHSGLPTTIVRPHNVYGPRMGNSHVVPQLLQRISGADGGQVVVHSPAHRRTFCHIDDAVEYLVRLMVEPSAVGRTVNLGVQDPEVTMRELADLLVGVVGARVELVDGEVHPGSPERRRPDTTMLRSLTGHDPTVTLVEGLRRTWEWYRRGSDATT